MPGSNMLKTSRVSKQQFANRLRTLRAERSLKASELAKSTGVSPASVWQWEHGGVVPREGTLVKLAGELQVSPSYLLTGSKQVPVSESTDPAPPSSLNELPLEDLIKAIQAKGFKVSIETY